MLDTSPPEMLKKRKWDRDPDDWYVEPEDCSVELLKYERFGAKHVIDPSCGIGRIVRALLDAGYSAYGTDIVSRGPFCADIQDFMSPMWTPPVTGTFDLMTNGPFQEINPKGYRWDKHDPEGTRKLYTDRVLDRMAHKAALLMPATFITSSGHRAKWLEGTPLARVYFIVPRPSMPPGAVILAGEKPGGGEEDFCWCIFERGHTGDRTLHWLHRGGRSNAR